MVTGGAGGMVVVGGAGGASGGASSGGTGATATDDPEVMVASFVAETEAGRGPALVTFHNDTEFTQSLWVGQAAFVELLPGTVAGPELAASAAVEVDTTTGKHSSFGCVVYHLAEYTGPQLLEPGKHYSMSVKYVANLGFVGTLTGAPGDPFVAVRAEVHESKPSNSVRPSQVALEFGGARGSVARWSTYDDSPTNYLHIGPTGFSGKVSFTARTGSHYQTSSTAELAATPGYTIVIAEQPVKGATATLTLERQ